MIKNTRFFLFQKKKKSLPMQMLLPQC